MTINDAARTERVLELQGVPLESVVDESITVRVAGCRPEARVTLVARLCDRSGRLWESCNVYVAGRDGIVDLSRDQPIRGSYRTVDAMGFAWSMSITGETCAEAPRSPGLAPVTFVIVAMEEDGPTVTTSLLRLAAARGVTCVEVREDGLVGLLLTPPGAGPFPGILVLGGSEGGLNAELAARYASHGYAALALAYFGVEHLPDELTHIPLEYFERAIQWLRSRPSVDPTRLAISGASRGGELALLLAARHHVFRAVIAVAPSSVVYSAMLGADDDGGERCPPAWTHGGAEVPYLCADLQLARAPAGVSGKRAPLELARMFLATLQDEDSVEQATICVEDIAAPVLLISGQEDAVWPSALYCERVMHRLATHGHPFADLHVSYPGAGHAIGAPHAPVPPRLVVHPTTGDLIDLGGDPAQTAAASRDGWERQLAFLDEHVMPRHVVSTRSAAARVTADPDESRQPP